MLGCPIMMSYDASCPGTLSPDRFDLLTKTDENMSLYVKARMLSCHAPAMLIGGSGGLAGVCDARPSCGNVCVKMCQTRHEQLIFDMRNSLATHEQRNSFFCPVCSWLKRRYGPRQPVAILNLALSWSFFWDETPLPPPVSRTDPEMIHSASSKRSKCLESQIDQFESRSHVATFVQRMQTWIEFKIAFVPCRAGLLAEKHVGCTLPVHFVEKDEQCHLRYLEETVSQMFFGFLSQLVVSWGRRQNLWDNKLLSLV